MGGYPQQGFPPQQMGFNDLWEFQFKASGLDRKDVFSKSDPFFVVYGQRGIATKVSKGKKIKKMKNTRKYKVDGSWVAIYKSEHIMVKKKKIKTKKKNFYKKKKNF